MLQKLIDSIFNRKKASEESKDVYEPEEFLPAVEFTTDENWDDTVALYEDDIIMIDGRGNVYRLVGDEWRMRRDIIDVRINHKPL